MVQSIRDSGSIWIDAVQPGVAACRRPAPRQIGLTLLLVFALAGLYDTVETGIVSCTEAVARAMFLQQHPCPATGRVGHYCQGFQVVREAVVQTGALRWAPDAAVPAD